MSAIITRIGLLLLLGFVGGCDGPRREQTASQPPIPAPIYVPPAPPPEPPKVESFVLLVTVLCEYPFAPKERVWEETAQVWIERPDPRHQLAEAPEIGTNIALIRDDGTFLRLSDSRQVPVAMTYEDGRYFLTVQYQPDDLTQVVGKPIADVASFGRLETHFSKVLAAHRLTFLGIAKVELVVNGVRTSLSDRMRATEVIELSPGFRTAASAAARQHSGDPAL